MSNFRPRTPQPTTKNKIKPKLVFLTFWRRKKTFVNASTFFVVTAQPKKQIRVCLFFAPTDVDLLFVVQFWLVGFGEFGLLLLLAQIKQILERKWMMCG
jgi:hypothetical protein